MRRKSSRSADVLREMGTGTIQAGGGQYVELKDGMMRRLAEATGRTVVYNSPVADDAPPGRVEDPHGADRGDRRARHPRLSDVQPEPGDAGLHDEEHARCSAACRPGTRSCLMSDEEKLRLYADPEIRAKLHEEAVVNKPDSAVGISKTWWNYIWVNEPVLEKNKWMQFKSIGQIAEKQGKRVIDAFLDLVVEEKLETRFLQAENNIDDEALTKILTHPERGDRARRRRRARAVPRRLRLSDQAARRMGAREAGHVAGAGGAPADLRLGLDLRPLRPRPAAPGHGRPTS